MGLNQVGNQAIWASTNIATPATPVLVGNNGAFSAVTRLNTGQYVFTLDDEFLLEPDDTIEVTLQGLVSVEAKVVARVAANEIQVDVSDGNTLPLDSPIGVVVRRTLRG